MQVLLDGLLPRLFPTLPFLCVPHEGKTDLERSVPRKLRAWREPGVRFVVVRDNDGKDCRALKDALRQLCHAGHRDDTLIRIACQELEAWYLGEPQVVAHEPAAGSFSQDSLSGQPRRYRGQCRDGDCCLSGRHRRASAAAGRVVQPLGRLGSRRAVAGSANTTAMAPPIRRVVPVTWYGFPYEDDSQY